MKCPSCGNDNKENSFCTKCGVRLSTKSKPVNSKRRSKSGIYFGSPKIFGILSVTLIGLITLFIFLGFENNSDSNIVDSSPTKITKDSPNNNSTTDSTTASTPFPSPKKVFDDKDIVGNLIEEVAPSAGVSFWGFRAFNKEFNKDYDSDYPVSAIAFGQFEISDASLASLTPEGWSALKELVKTNVFVETDFGAGFSRDPQQSIDCDDDERTCLLTLNSYNSYVTKKYSNKMTLKFRFNIPETVSKSEAGADYYDNLEIVNTYIQPATCAMAYEKMSEYLKGYAVESRFFINQLTSPKYGIC